jgi:hypothetical protein
MSNQTEDKSEQSGRGNYILEQSRFQKYHELTKTQER